MIKSFVLYDEFDYLNLLSNKDIREEYIFASIYMSSRNSSLRKDSIALEYLEKILNKCNYNINDRMQNLSDEDKVILAKGILYF